MDAEVVRQLRAALAHSTWGDRTAEFAGSLRSARHDPGGLLLVGTPDAEPWHLSAHLADEARWAELPQLAPTWVRWAPPPGAPAHLAVGMQRLEQVRRGETVLVATPAAATDPLLERVADARRTGALVLAVEDSPSELQDLAHDALAVSAAPVSYDLVTHLVSVAAGSPGEARARGVRARLARVLDRLGGPDA